MQYLNEKARVLAHAGSAPPAEPTIPALAVQILRALLLVCWRRAARVLSVGGCNVH